MSVADNREIARRFVEEVWGRGDFALEAELLAANMREHTPGPGCTPDRDGHHQLLAGIHAAYSEIRFTLDDVVVEGEMAADRWTMHAVHTGIFGGIPPTGKRVTITGMDVMRIIDGKIVDLWHLEDQLGLPQQLGVIPGPAPAG